MLFSPEIDPSGQVVHVVAALLWLYLPTSQPVHSDEPELLLYLPTSQPVHADEPELLLYVPTSQRVHAVDPFPRYVPCGQGTHTDILTAMCPMGHQTHHCGMQALPEPLGLS